MATRRISQRPRDTFTIAVPTGERGWHFHEMTVGTALKAPARCSWLMNWPELGLWLDWKVQTGSSITESEMGHVEDLCQLVRGMPDVVRAWAAGRFHVAITSGIFQPNDLFWAGENLARLGLHKHFDLGEFFISPIATETDRNSLQDLVDGSICMLTSRPLWPAQARRFLNAATKRFEDLSFDSRARLLLWILFGVQGALRDRESGVSYPGHLLGYPHKIQMLPVGDRRNFSPCQKVRAPFYRWAVLRYHDLLLTEPGHIAHAQYLSLFCDLWLSCGSGMGSYHHKSLCRVSLDWLLKLYHTINQWNHASPLKAEVRKLFESRLMQSSWIQTIERRVQPEAERRWPKLSQAVARPSCAAMHFKCQHVKNGFVISHPVYASVQASVVGTRWRVRRLDLPRGKPIYVHPLGGLNLAQEMASLIAASWQVGELPAIEGLRRDQVIGLATYGRIVDTTTKRDGEYVRAGIGRLVMDAWRSLLPRFSPQQLRASKLLYSLRPWSEQPPALFLKPALWRNSYLVQDLVTYPAARIALRFLADHHATTKPTDLEHLHVIDAVLAGRRSWMDVLTPTWTVEGSAYRALRRMAMNLPKSIRVGDLKFLEQYRVPAPITHIHHFRLVNAYLLRRSHDMSDENFWALLRVSRDEICEAMQLLFDHPRSWLRGGITYKRSPRRMTCNQILQSPWAMAKVFADVFDFAPIRGGLRAYVRDSIDWHQHADRFDRLQQADPTITIETPLPAPGLFELDVGSLGPEVQVTRLTTVGELFAEGDRMRHCVGSYAHRALAGGCFIYHLVKDGEATVELGPNGEVVQVRGHCNESNIPVVLWAQRNLPKLIRPLASSQAG